MAEEINWAERLCEMMQLPPNASNLDLAAEFLDHYQVASGKEFDEHVKMTESSEWRKAVQNELVVLHILDNSNEENPRKALQDIIEWNQKIALDPAVSKEARDLQASGQTILVKFDGRAMGGHSTYGPVFINPTRVGWAQRDGRNTNLLIDGKWFEVSGKADEVAKRLGIVKGE